MNYKFPKITKANMAFPTFDTPEILLKEAKDRGFYGGFTEWNQLFNKWFFSGLEKAPNFKEGIDEKYAQDAMNWAVSYMRSFAPKHEEKEAVCALIFSECLSPTSS